MHKRLHIGAGRLEKLPLETSKIFADESWLNLGDNSVLKTNYQSKMKEILTQRTLSNTIKKIPTIISKYLKKGENIEYQNFVPFYYQKGDSLNFQDNTFSFIYSEHFFEHLFFDEASALFKELYRILKVGGVIRTVVPDADLRTYETPENYGSPDKKMPFTNPWKHKTRWNVYMLSELLELVGYKSIPLVYCDKEAKFINNIENIEKIYKDMIIVDDDIINQNSYIIRKKSLIVDGIK